VCLEGVIRRRRCSTEGGRSLASSLPARVQFQLQMVSGESQQTGRWGACLACAAGGPKWPGAAGQQSANLKPFRSRGASLGLGSERLRGSLVAPALFVLYTRLPTKQKHCSLSAAPPHQRRFCRHRPGTPTVTYFSAQTSVP